MMRIGRRLLLVVAVVAVAVAGWAAPAFAHAQLLSTNPASGSVIAKSPGTVVLDFGEDVEIQFGAVRVYNSGSKRVDDGASYHPNGDGHAVAVKVPSNLAAGGYVVTWRVISADSHPVHGAFTFLIGAGGASAATAATSQATRLLATTGGSLTVGVVFGVDRFLAFAALFILVGGAAFVAGAWPEGRDDERARWLLLAGLIGAVVTTLAAIALQGPYGGGLPLLKALSPTVFREVLKTRFGEVYLARLVILLLAAAPLMWRLRRPGPLPRWWKLAGIATGAAILVTPGLAGHAATGSLIFLAIPFDLVHVSAAAVWVGGLCVLAVAVLVPRKDRDKPNPLKTVLPRYSQWALVAVLALAVSGGFAAWRQIGSLDAVTTTTYGRLVLAKTIIFLVLVGIATKSRSIVHGNLALPFGLSGPKQSPVPALAGAGVARSAGVPRSAGSAPVAGSEAATATGSLIGAGGDSPNGPAPLTGTAPPNDTATPDSGAGSALAASSSVTSVTDAGGDSPNGTAPPAATAGVPVAGATAAGSMVTAAVAGTPDVATTPDATTGPDLPATPDTAAGRGGVATSDATIGSTTAASTATPDTAATSSTAADPDTDATPDGTAMPTEAGVSNGASASEEVAETEVAATTPVVPDGSAPPADVGPAASAPGPRSPGPGAMAAPARSRPTWDTRQARPVRRRNRGQRQADLRRAVGLEVLFAGVVIALTAILVNAQPARQALALPFSAEVHAGPNVLVDVVVDPAKAGPVAIHVYTLTAAGAQLDVPEISATMSLASGSAPISGLNVPLQRGGAGHFLIAGFDVPERGTWTLDITVQTSKFDEFYATPIKVKMR